jgi:DNA-binding CsgD family transcriptional regulator
MQTGCRLPAAGSANSTERARLQQLTAREHEVLLEVARGMTNAEIADRLVLSEATIKTHVGRFLSKLDLRDRVQIVVFGYEAGPVTPADGLGSTGRSRAMGGSRDRCAWRVESRSRRRRRRGVS